MGKKKLKGKAPPTSESSDRALNQKTKKKAHSSNASAAAVESIPQGVTKAILSQKQIRTTSMYPQCHVTLSNGMIVKYNMIEANSPQVALNRDGRLLQLQLFDEASCGKLISLTNQFTDWDDISDSVDNRSENQHNIFDLAKGTDDGILFPLCEQISSVVLQPILKKHLGLANLKLHWAFIRKYNMEGRLEFPVHRDSSAATVNILLSDPMDFQGAELYLLGNEHKNADMLSDKQFRRLLPEDVLRQRYSVPYSQGCCCMHSGKVLHGVLPLVSGVRYTLILMYLP